MVFLLLFLILFEIIIGDDPLIWPLPQHYSLNSCLFPVSNNFTFNVVNQNINNDILIEGINRYKSLIFPRIPDLSPKNSAQLLVIDIELENPMNTELNIDTNETYSLNIPFVKGEYISGKIYGNNVFGVLKGLETFSQLIVYNYTLGYYVLKYCNVAINDYPRFKHRGIMLDTSRHFISVNIIKELLDSMEYNKFNVFHWHITDAESFPYLSFMYPLFTLYGAYSQNEIYSHNDIKNIVNYAKYRGIRTIIEFDTPGHTGSWCKGFPYPTICPNKTCVQHYEDTNPNDIALDPSTDDTYNIIDGIFSEIFNPNNILINDNYIHLGADEVVYRCWEETPSITAWMNQMGFTNYDQVYEYFVLRVINMTNTKYGKNVILWNDAYNTFGSSLNKDITTIQVWKNVSVLANVVQDGFNAILSNSNAWYLIYTSITWEQMYLNEPYTYIHNTNQQKLVLGGEGCQWTEYSDNSDILSIIWPRGSAIAERLWSNINVNNITKALPRLQYFRCLMNIRGISAGIVNTQTAGSPPANPQS